MTTLDDLTPTQRQELIGTWIDLKGATQPHIYLGEFTSSTSIRHGAWLFNPTYTDTYVAFEDCTPRPDLPRAWSPNGTPPAGEWEYAVECRRRENSQWHQVTEWDSDPNPYVPGHTPHKNERIIRRLVSETEVMEP